MLVSTENSQESISESNITDFENEYNIKLPDAYKAFLIKNNGGKPTPRKFNSVDKKITSRIMLFFPLGKFYPKNLANNYEVFVEGNKIPKNLLPIGEDPINNLICMSIDGKDYGAIYYWSMDYEEDGFKASYKYIRLVSESFTEFINSLSE